MELQTRVEIRQPDFTIDYHKQILLIGSCFVENMGDKLNYFRFPVDVNPCGIVYNPLSVANVLNLLLDEKMFTKNDLLQNQGRWVSLYHHGHFSATNPDICLESINNRLNVSAENLKKTDLLILTWGTSWVFRYRETGAIASNCHKIPASAFERFRLSVTDIVEEYTRLIARLREQNPQVKILFTVSPIRHWKDGAHGNQLSKSVLLLAIDELVHSLDNVSYFPSYEIVMDELRDYRFYAEDMLHVSPQAANYIWERFKETYISEKLTPFMQQVDKINKMKQHRSTDINSEEYRKLQDRIQRAEDELETFTIK